MRFKQVGVATSSMSHARPDGRVMGNLFLSSLIRIEPAYSQLRSDAITIKTSGLPFHGVAQEDLSFAWFCIIEVVLQEACVATARGLCNCQTSGCLLVGRPAKVPEYLTCHMNYVNSRLNQFRSQTVH